MWQSPQHQSASNHRLPHSFSFSTRIRSRPPRARADDDALDVDFFVLMAGVEHDTAAAATQSLCKLACVLKDAGVSRRLEEVNLGDVARRSHRHHTKRPYADGGTDSLQPRK
jgi:hypothetical protein